MSAESEEGRRGGGARGGVGGGEDRKRDREDDVLESTMSCRRVARVLFSFWLNVGACIALRSAFITRAVQRGREIEEEVRKYF